ncbi:RNA polymerase sigma-70 factor (ECF subfamily) [Nocardiopsis arvandica]|uniref:RNA polymerase sigma-70 factor (ECF subfamily) n=1 Tax=Nocardiopsis sinuspersici TaxID=501010 RepID=A0A7Y9XDC4_9ACTN|nr:ECF RNA polymerase sigma factor SigK [Nocardiopsis sinuspersici]NYH52660.1 RNA polymerase sigma-70 factor (ECF subfamily) [Nocardiopsis sinuspersici]
MKRTAEWEHGEAEPPGGGGARDEPLARLLQQAAVGDLAAFEGVYRRLSGPVFGIARRVMLNEAQAEEVCQEVFLEVWRTCARYDRSRGSVSAWVLTIAHRRAVDRVRSEQAASTRLAAAGRLESEATPRDSVPDQVEHRLERERVRRCLRGLTETQREAVRLTYYTGYTQRQAADLLKVPLTTVKGRLRDGLIRLRDCLGVGV